MDDKTKAKLERELTKIEKQMDQLRETGDPSKIKTQMELAGLDVRWWLVRKRLATKVSDEIDIDRRIEACRTSFRQLSKELANDLLPDIQKKMAEWDGAADALNSLN